MTPAGLVAIRKAAALAHAVPGLRLRLTHDGSPLAEIGHDVLVRTEGLPMRLTPCQFRVALLRVIDGTTAMRPIVAFGLPVGVDPAVHLGVCRTRAMAVHPFGLVAWSEDDRRGCTFVTSLHGSAVEEVLAGMDGDDAVRARVRSDERLGTAVVELSSTTVGVDHLVGLSRDVVVQCTVEELTRPQALVRW